MKYNLKNKNNLKIKKIILIINKFKKFKNKLTNQIFDVKKIKISN